jgi:photosystem II stability/assembly factor-like uncharacterized protein
MRRLLAATGDSVALLTGDGELHTQIKLAGTGVQCLAVDPGNPGVAYAGSYGQGIYKTVDGGESWSALESPHNDIFSLAVSAADGSVYAGCEPSMLYRSRDGGASWEELDQLRSIPSAPTWSFPPRPWTSHVRWVAPSPHDPGLLLVGIELGGLMRSGDGGRSWEDHRPGAQRDVHCLLWHPTAPGRAYEAGGGGAAWSKDGGRSWEAADQGRDLHYTWALACDGSDPDVWYVSASPGPYYAHGGADARAHIYRWRAGGPWQTLGGGLPQPLSAMPYALAYAGDHLFAGLSDGAIYVTSDQGDTWTEVTMTSDPPSAIRALVALELPTHTSDQVRETLEEIRR